MILTTFNHSRQGSAPHANSLIFQNPTLCQFFTLLYCFPLSVWVKHTWLVSTSEIVSISSNTLNSLELWIFLKLNFPFCFTKMFCGVIFYPPNCALVYICQRQYRATSVVNKQHKYRKHVQSTFCSYRILSI